MLASEFLDRNPKARAPIQPAGRRPVPASQATPEGRGWFKQPVLAECQLLCLVPRFNETRSARHASTAS